jgi:2-oxoglutarate ferredoxin oxidoreductase subunit alpha
MMQARWGSHGDYEIIALSPGSPQELFDLTLQAFNLSEKYRTPVLVMTDAEVGHMTEKVVIPPVEEVEIIHRPLAEPGQIEPEHFRIYRSGSDGNSKHVSPMVRAGDGYRIHVTGLTHDERGYPAMNPEANQWNVNRLMDKIRANTKDIIQLEKSKLRNAEVVVVSYGISARTSLWPIELARKQGIKVGYLRLITVWPFPEEVISRLADKVKAFIVPEINMGQISREVERCVCGKAEVIGVHKAGGDILDPEDVLGAIRKGAGLETGD